MPAKRHNNWQNGREVISTVEEYQEALAPTGFSLRLHQIDGVKKTLAWYRSGHGGIVADEMGLGKTCQTIALMCIMETTEHEPRYLVICPLSVVDHWEEEMRRFGLGKLHVVRYTGDPDRRNALRKEMKTSNWNVVLTTYQLVLHDSTKFTNAWKFSAVFFDEAQRVKSYTSVLHEIVRRINVEFFLALTGTPIQNNLNELFALLTLVDKIRFPMAKVDDFLKKYNNMENEEIAGELRHLLSSYLLRRTKEKVAIEIPSSNQVILYHGMSDVQKKLYRAILRKNYRFFQQANKQALMNIMMQLRKCVCHPYLFNGIEPKPYVEGEHLVEASGKFAVFDRLLSFLHSRCHRVLVFSQMTRVLDVAQDMLDYRGYSYERLDGRVKAKERSAAVRSFQKPKSSVFCFLLSTRAGGLGLTLTGADTVIFLDSDFNPQNDLQAAARCHRIGQEKPVKVIRLVGRNTVEEVVQCYAIRKLRLTHQILGADGFEKQHVTTAVLANMLLFGLSKLTRVDAEHEKKVLSDLEIEEIIGSTKFGKWSVEPSNSQDGEGADVTDVENKPPESTAGTKEKAQDMYFFEGHNYRKDRQALEEIVAEDQDAEITVLRSGAVKRKSLEIENEGAKRERTQ